MNVKRSNTLAIICMPATELIAGSRDGPVLEGEYVVVPDGLVKSSSGDFVLDATAADRVVQKFVALKRDLAVDYEHHSLGDEFESRTGKAPAAGWIKRLRYVAGKGLLAMIRWVPEAAELIRSGAYRYLSPVTVIDRKSKRVVELFNAALATNPAIVGMPPLTAFSRRIFVMADEPQDTGQSVDTLIVSIRELLSLPAEASPRDVLQAAIETLKAGQGSEKTSTDDSANRATIINKASSWYGHEPQLQKFTSRAAFVNDALREAGLTLLTHDERVRHA